MRAYRSDRVVRLLSRAVAIAYFGAWGLSAMVLVAMPAIKVLAGGDGALEVGLPVPASVVDAEATVLTRWGEMRMEVEDVRGSFRMPVSVLPWSLFAVLWTYVAVCAGLTLLFLGHLRRIFEHVRRGVPFDAENAIHLRWLGVLLLGLAVITGVTELVTSLAVRSGLASDSIVVPTLSIDVSLVFVALVLLVLGEIFRYGAELEDEQSYVV
jgi:hypothetical protein